MKSESDEYKNKFGIVIEDIPSNAIELMSVSLESLLAATNNYKKSHVGVLMSYGNHERPMSQTLHFSNYYSTEGLWCRGCNQSRDASKEELESNLFQQLVFADYFIHMEAGQIVPSDLFTQIDGMTRNKKACCFGFNGVYAVLKSAVRNHYYECGSYKDTEKYIVEFSKSKGLYKEL